MANHTVTLTSTISNSLSVSALLKSTMYTSKPLLNPSSEALHNLCSIDRQLFCIFGEGTRQQPAFPTVIDAFHHAVTEHPNLTAATLVNENGSLDSESSISYSELNHEANKLATILQRHGVENDDAIPIFLRRSIQMLIGIIAVLKLGACYVPQHVGVAPSKQLQDVAKVTNAKVVLTMAALEHKLPDFLPHVSIIPIDTVMDMDFPAQAPILSRPVRPGDRCYIIFTSGTTGAPKGVQVTHGNVANILLTSPMDLGMGPSVLVGQILSIAFDMGAWEILGALSHAATLVIRHRSISDAVQHVDIVISTPTVLGTLNASQMTHVKTVAVAGEPCPRSLAAEWSKFARFYNSCGPTETTIVNTAKLFSPEADVLTIGTPTPNNTVYVLNPETLQPCKIGEVGEMWAGGSCVSAGYLNKPELTAGRYLPDPFIGCENMMMYKTGDLGRWDSNGELEHYGRVDDQVKVKGFRVELDGVSAVAETVKGVTKAVILKVENDLVAFVTPAGVNEESVKLAIGKRLPYYCTPARVFCFEEFPRTGNGKVDKKKLRELSSSEGKHCEVSTENIHKPTTSATIFALLDVVLRVYHEAFRRIQLMALCLK